MPVVEIRCPEDPRRILSKLLLTGARPRVTDNNLIEISCDSCRARLRKSGTVTTIVLHRYDLVGTLVETVVA